MGAQDTTNKRLRKKYTSINREGVSPFARLIINKLIEVFVISIIDPLIPLGKTNASGI